MQNTVYMLNAIKTPKIKTIYGRCHDIIISFFIMAKRDEHCTGLRFILKSHVYQSDLLMCMCDNVAQGN